ncbi:MAG TPA: LuxR C-terminal-related transcriptional regulator [Verrucomicrobiae bacterium]|jgi:PAS domain S-box-containing protein
MKPAPQQPSGGSADEVLVAVKKNLPGAVAALSPRERDVLALMSKGCADKEIASSLGLSVWTVHGYVKKIFERLGVHTRTEAVIRAQFPEEGKFERLLSSLRDVIYSVDVRTQEFAYLSPSFEKIFGYTAKDIHEMGGRETFLRNVIKRGLFSEQQEILKELKLGKTIKKNRHVAWWRCKNGSSVCIEDHWSATYEAGLLISTDGVLRDITRQKKLELELERVYRKYVKQTPPKRVS